MQSANLSENDEDGDSFLNLMYIYSSFLFKSQESSKKNSLESEKETKTYKYNNNIDKKGGGFSIYGMRCMYLKE